MTTAAQPIPVRFLFMADLLHMFVAALLLNLFLFVGTEVPMMFQLAITTLIMVVIVRGGGWLVLGAMQVSMFFYETPRGIYSIDLSTILFGCFCLAYVAYASGFRTIRRWLREWLGRMLYLWFVEPPQKRQQNPLDQQEARQDQLASWLRLRTQSWSLLLRSLRLLLIVIVSSIVFVQLPTTMPGIRAWWNRTVEMDLKLWPGPNVFTVALVCLLAITLGAWRRLNRDQARLYLKSFFVRAHFRELRSVLVRSGRLSELRPTATVQLKKTVTAAPSRGK